MECKFLSKIHLVPYSHDLVDHLYGNYSKTSKIVFLLNVYKYILEKSKKTDKNSYGTLYVGPTIIGNVINFDHTFDSLFRMMEKKISEIFIFLPFDETKDFKRALEGQQLIRERLLFDVYDDTFSSDFKSEGSTFSISLNFPTKDYQDVTLCPYKVKSTEPQVSIDFVGLIASEVRSAVFAS